MFAPKDQIWRLLQSSGLLLPQQLESAQAEYAESRNEPSRNSSHSHSPDTHSQSSQVSGTTGSGPTPSASLSRQPAEEHIVLLDWLCDQQLISGFHREIIGAGCAGPFNFGEYLLVERIGKTGSDDSESATRTAQHYPNYIARHQPSGHMVELIFFPDNTDRKIWNAARDWAENRRGIESPFLFSVYQAVLLPEYRFLVRELTTGKCLLEKIPFKNRLPWEKSCKLISGLANALHELHIRKLNHENLWPGNVYLQNDGTPTLRMDLDANLRLLGVESSTEKLDVENGSAAETAGMYRTDDAIDDQADWYSLGCLLFRLISGRAPKWEGDDDLRKKRIAALQKYDVPKPVLKLVNRLTSTSSEERLTSKILLEHLERSNTLELTTKASWRGNSHHQLVRQIASRLPPSELPMLGPAPVNQVDSFSPVVAVEDRPTGLASGENASSKSFVSRKRQRNLINLSLAVGTGILACGIVGLIMAWSLGVFDEPVATSQSNPQGSPTPKDKLESKVGKTTESQTKSEPNQNEIDSETGWLRQTVVEGDGGLPWESPTDGRPIDWDGVPVAPDFVFVIRPSEILETDEGPLAFRALGQDLAVAVEEWRSRAGVELSQIQQLIVSLHSDGSPEFKANFVVRLIEPIDVETLAEKWNAPIEDIEDANGTFFSGDKFSFLAEVRENQIHSFVMASDQFLRDSIEYGVTTMGGAMGRLSEQCDGSRHFNAFFLPRILSNEQSQELFSGDLQKVRRPLMLFFDDRINGTLFSVHFTDELLLGNAVRSQPGHRGCRA